MPASNKVFSDMFYVYAASKVWRTVVGRRQGDCLKVSNLIMIQTKARILRTMVTNMRVSLVTWAIGPARCDGRSPRASVIRNHEFTYIVTFSQTTTRMLTFTRRTLVFDIPDAPKALSAASDEGGIRSALKSCSDAALKALDDIEQNLQPLRNFLRSRRDAYVRERSNLLRSQDYRPFDVLPDEMVVEVFKEVLAPPGENGPNGTPPLDRFTLSQVCQRWKNILESVPCITTPKRCFITMYRQTLESGYVSINLCRYNESDTLFSARCPPEFPRWQDFLDPSV